MLTLNTNDKISFGKHKGLTVGQVMYNDIQYLQWCLDENVFNLDDETTLEYMNVMEESDV